MTPEQYERWEDFALRMARTCFPKHRRPNSRWIVYMVNYFFAQFDEDDTCCIRNWDNSDPYPEGHHRRWQTGVGPSGPRWASPYGVGDMVTEFLDEYRGYAPRCQACNASHWAAIGRDDCRCEDIEWRYHEQWDEQWAGPVRCCIRAGLDMASAPSGGVIGFTAGDVRRMYPEGVPAWVFPPGERLSYWPSGETNGIFAELTDDAQMVL